jgi:hypothetical protein
MVACTPSYMPSKGPYFAVIMSLFTVSPIIHLLASTETCGILLCNSQLSCEFLHWGTTCFCGKMCRDEFYSGVEKNPSGVEMSSLGVEMSYSGVLILCVDPGDLTRSQDVNYGNNIRSKPISAAKPVEISFLRV